MKETKESAIIILAEELTENGVYFSSTNQLIKIDKIDNEKQELILNNLTEQVKYYNMPISRHNLVKRIR